MPALPSARSWKLAQVHIHFWEWGSTLRPCILVIARVFLAHKFTVAFYLAFSCDSLFQHMQPNND